MVVGISTRQRARSPRSSQRKRGLPTPKSWQAPARRPAGHSCGGECRGSVLAKQEEERKRRRCGIIPSLELWSGRKFGRFLGVASTPRPILRGLPMRPDQPLRHRHLRLFLGKPSERSFFWLFQNQLRNRSRLPPLEPGPPPQPRRPPQPTETLEGSLALGTVARWGPEGKECGMTFLIQNPIESVRCDFSRQPSVPLPFQ